MSLFVIQCFDVYNNILFACGQIAVAPLANGGPAPNLFHENIFNLMVTKYNTDLSKSTEFEKYFVPDEHECFSQIKTNPINILILFCKMVIRELLMLKRCVF